MILAHVSPAVCSSMPKKSMPKNAKNTLDKHARENSKTVPGQKSSKRDTRVETPKGTYTTRHTTQGSPSHKLCCPFGPPRCNTPPARRRRTAKSQEGRSLRTVHPSNARAPRGSVPAPVPPEAARNNGRPRAATDQARAEDQAAPHPPRAPRQTGRRSQGRVVDRLARARTPPSAPC